MKHQCANQFARVLDDSARDLAREFLAPRTARLDSIEASLNRVQATFERLGIPCPGAPDSDPASC